MQGEQPLIAKPTHFEADESPIYADGWGRWALAGGHTVNLLQNLDTTISAVGLCGGFTLADQHP
jgi:hypothetical protein